MRKGNRTQVTGARARLLVSALAFGLLAWPGVGLAAAGGSTGETLAAEGTSAAAERHTLSLQQAIELAMRQGSTMKSNQITYETARLDYEKARADQLVNPSVLSHLQAETNWRVAQQNFALSKVDLAASVETAYYDVLKSQRALGLSETNYEQTQAQLEATRTRYNMGMVAAIDLLNAETAMATALSDLSRAQANLAISKMRLNRMLGLPLSAEVSLSDDLTVAEETFDLEKDLEHALATRLEIQSALDRVALAAKTVEVNDNAFTPLLTLERARLDLQKAELDLANTRDNIVLEVQQNYQTLLDLKTRIGIQEQNVVRWEENLKAVRLRFQAGAVTALDVAEAQKQLYTAQTQALQAVFDYNEARARYLRSVGRTSP